MIRCQCGELFRSGCEHAQHKLDTGEPKSHMTVCSDCGQDVGLPEGKNVGTLKVDRGVPVEVLCKACA